MQSPCYGYGECAYMRTICVNQHHSNTYEIRVYELLWHDCYSIYQQMAVISLSLSSILALTDCLQPVYYRWAEKTKLKKHDHQRFITSRLQWRHSDERQAARLYRHGEPSGLLEARESHEGREGRWRLGTQDNSLRMPSHWRLWVPFFSFLFKIYNKTEKIILKKCILVLVDLNRAKN